LLLDNPVAAGDGISTFLSQGAMSSITDVPEFASEIAEAGGLPHYRPRLMDAKDCDRRLGRLREIMGERRVCGECRLPGREPIRKRIWRGYSNTDPVSSGSPEEISPR